MLVHQAAEAFRIWTGQEPPIDVMSAAALHALNHAR
jgi:shikimate dehydrogenase